MNMQHPIMRYFEPYPVKIGSRDNRILTVTTPRWADLCAALATLGLEVCCLLQDVAGFLLISVPLKL